MGGTWGDFDTSTVTALAGGDDVDIYFTCNWSADEYNKYARDGYWVKLDDMLEKDAPELLATIPEGIWECARTNGLDGSEVYGTVHHSIISIGCTVGEGALVEDSVVMPGVVIESGAIVRHAILGENSRVCKNAIVGGAYAGGEKKKISVTSKGAVVEANTVLKPGDML